jgi:hypothetical protein
MSDKKILSKIEKLLSLSDSPNQHEAESAMAMAVKLATQYNVDLSRVAVDQRQTDLYTKEIFDEKSSRLPITMQYTVAIIQKFFSVRVVTVGNRWSGRALTFIGKQSDIENAKFIYGFLNSTFLRLWHNFYKKNPYLNVKTSRKSYFLGLFQGLYAKLDAAKKAVESSIHSSEEQQYQIMLVNDEKLLNDAMVAFYPNLRKAPRAETVYENNDVVSAGKKEGANINIHAGLTNSETHSLSS